MDKHVDGNNKKKLALLYENSEEEVNKYTFYEMKLLTNKFGNILRELNFKKGDRILIRLPDIPEFQICFIGSVKIGAVPIPSSTMFRAKEVAYRINDSKAKAVVTTSQYVNEVNEIRKSCPSLKHVIIIDNVQENDVSYKEMMKNASTKLELEKTKSTDISFFCYTSGTTGKPKGVLYRNYYTLSGISVGREWEVLGLNNEIIKFYC